MFNRSSTALFHITFSQIADGGDLEPQMFGLTTKFNKMQKDSINHETPAIGNVLLAADFLSGMPYSVKDDEYKHKYVREGNYIERLTPSPYVFRIVEEIKEDGFIWSDCGHEHFVKFSDCQVCR